MGFDKIPDITDCANQRYMAGAAGFVTAITGLDRLLPLPPVVHYAVAGAATDAYCQGTVELNQQLAMCAVGGIIGGVVGSFLVR